MYAYIYEYVDICMYIIHTYIIICVYDFKILSSTNKLNKNYTIFASRWILLRAPFQPVRFPVNR